MLPAFLLPETESRQNGVGPAVPIDRSSRPLQLTLGITRILEQETLELSVWGSADGSAWHQVATFPPKSYCGTYLLHLSPTPQFNTSYLRVEWRMSRWRERDVPLFGFYVFAEEARLRRHAGAA